MRHAFLDFSTVEARRLNGEREVQLNRRLAANVYYGVVPLVVCNDGRRQLGGEGPIVDWRIKMRRLPSQRMLDAAIGNKTVSGDVILRLGRMLTGFYRRSTLVVMRAFDYRKHFDDDIRATHAELAKPQFKLTLSQVEHLTRAQLAFVDEHGALLELRAREKRIFDAHAIRAPNTSA